MTWVGRVSGIRVDDDDVHGVAGNRAAGLVDRAGNDDRHELRHGVRWIRAVAWVGAPVRQTSGRRARGVGEALETPGRSATAEAVVLRPLSTPVIDGGARGEAAVADHERTAGKERKLHSGAAVRRREVERVAGKDSRHRPQAERLVDDGDDTAGRAACGGVSEAALGRAITAERDSYRPTRADRGDAIFLKQSGQGGSGSVRSDDWTGVGESGFLKCDHEVV